MRTFKVIVEQGEDGTYIVDCPTFKGCHSYGENIDEALENIKDVIEMCVEEAKDEGKQFDFPRIIEMKEVQVAV